MKRIPVTYRRLWQGMTLFLCVTPLLGLSYLDKSNARFVLLGIPFAVDRVIYLLVLAFVTLGILLFLSSRWGKVLCIFFCPLHCTLELRIDHRANRGLQALLWLTPLIFAQSAICLVFPYERQMVLFRAAAFPQPILICHGIVLSVLVGIFLVYRERFCHSLCPYGMFQGVLRSDVTVVTTLQDPEDRCIDCQACDRICPMRLDVRRQSTESFCSNCTRCIDACQRALGPNQEVITQILEADLACEQRGWD